MRSGQDAIPGWPDEDGPDGEGTALPDAPDPLELDLRSALAGNRFRLQWQAMVQCTTGDLLGFEAQVRWDRTGHAPVPPAGFLPVLRRLNLVRRFDQWLLHKACAAAAVWPGHRVAVNVSPSWFEGQGLVAAVAAALERSGLPPERLTIGLTEPGLVRTTGANPVPDGLRDLHRLKALGVSLSLNDFGGGGGALDLLHDTPFDLLKLDARLIARLGQSRRTEAIVRTLLQMTQALDLQAGAEGVERADQLAILQAYGCHQVQGLLIGHPESVLPDMLDLYDRLDRSRMFVSTADRAGAAAWS